MKYQLKQAMVIWAIVFVASSCEKIKMPDDFTGLAVSRKVQFSLYTSKDFSAYSDSISFLLRIRNSKGHTIWDSTLPKMRIKDIPNSENRIVVEKEVPDEDSSLLKVGFVYTIDNVGISWYQDTCRKSTALKKIHFDFR